jgi:hypothetical protein
MLPGFERYYMKARSFALAVLAALAFTSAYAGSPGNNGGGNGGCGTGQQTNGCGASPTTNHGGAGGAGGLGLGVGVGIAGAASLSTSHAQAISGGNTLAVTVQGDQVERQPAATAYAAPLTSSNGTCMGSSSIGAQGTLGLSFGTTWTDDSCDMRYDAQALAAVGQSGAAVARLCQKPEIAAAMEAAGTPCKGAKGKTAAATPAAPEPAVRTSQYVGSDPIVMKRLGLVK